MPNPLIIGGMHWWCPKHLEPFRERWPDGFILAQVGMFQLGVSDERVAKETGGDANRIQPVLNRHSPLCCWLPETKIAALVATCLRGEVYRDPDWPEEMQPNG